MANISINVPGIISTFPFNTLPGANLQYSAVPRARIISVIVEEVIALKIAGNTTSIKVRNQFPKNYAYVFEFATIDVAFPTEPADASNFDGMGVCKIRGGGPVRDLQLRSLGVAGHTLNAGSARGYSIIDMFPSPIFNDEGTTPQIDLEINDNDAAETAAGTVTSYVSVLQFDLGQVFNVGMNFPLPVSIR